jgi:uncharacterized protein YjbI with pentapeptide repeats
MIGKRAFVINNGFRMDTSTSTGCDDIKDQATKTNTKKDAFWYLTLFEILTILCAAAIPIALGIYAGLTSEQQQKEAEETRQFDLKQAAELRQQSLYDKFLNDMYNLDKDGQLADEKNPWVFANAYFRVAHRQCDAIRRADILQFLQEKQLIGKAISTKTRSAQQSDNIIRLNELNFDNIHLISQTGSLNQLNLAKVSFDQVSMINAKFSYVNLDNTTFNHARLNHVKFDDSSLVDAIFDSTKLQQADFGNSNLTRTRFLNVDLSTAKLTKNQLQQAIFYNTILPNGTLINSTTTTTTTTTTGEIFSQSNTKRIYLFFT